MTLRKKLLAAAVIIPPLSIALTGAAFANATFTCEKEDGTTFSAQVKYSDKSLKVENATAKTLYLVNGDDNRDINEIQLLLWDKDGNLVSRTIGQPDISSTKDIVAAAGGSGLIETTNADIAAQFNITWEDGYELWVEAKWRQDVHYKRRSESHDYGYLPFVYPVESNGTVNGLILSRNSWGLGARPLYNCHAQ
ncbi:hypothetical protein [Pseudoruegeria sp. HB172150]|uniref:hypothetical protein n=1 Tax=Pseudoruegeria sp. HB172150 TaxID=2721164 RepID=UPI0015540346|nr:hypothetical protein [Pseudoruegeria sp. HB172150]